MKKLFQVQVKREAKATLENIPLALVGSLGPSEKSKHAGSLWVWEQRTTEHC